MFISYMGPFGSGLHCSPKIATLFSHWFKFPSERQNGITIKSPHPATCRDISDKTKYNDFTIPADFQLC